MAEREYIIERIKSLPEENVKEVADFIEFLEAKRKKLVKEREGRDYPLLYFNIQGLGEGELLMV